MVQYPAPTNAVSSIDALKSTSTGSTTTMGESPSKGATGRSSAYDGNFEQHLIEHGLVRYHDRDTQTACNQEDICDQLDQPRSSLSPSNFSDEAF